MMKFIDKKNRGVLGEGRSYQMGFAFLKRDKNTYETVQPISPCKDYLNDVVWTEHTERNICAYGLNYNKQDIFDKKTSYIAISICSYYADMAKDIKNLKNNIKNLTYFMNYFEKQLKLNPTEITEVEDNKYILGLDYGWCKGTYLISLYSLLLRVGQFYDGRIDPLEWLEKFDAFPPDAYMVKAALPKLKTLIKDGFVKQDLQSMPGGTSVHNCGIVNFKF